MPLISIITAVFDPPRDAFEACVRSVLEQSLDDWEWCLANDGSTSEWVAPRLHELQRRDERIRVVDRSAKGGIVAASNDAVALAEGQFLVLLDNDDELSPDALRFAAHAIASQPDVDYLYSDEDTIGPDGRRVDRFQKPDWSPERLLAHNYTGRLSMFRRSLVNDVGRFRRGFEGAHDHDLVLRVTEKSRCIVHLPHVLYHRRLHPTSTAADSRPGPDANGASLRAVGDYLQRNGITADTDASVPNIVRVRRRIQREPDVAIIIPLVAPMTASVGEETPVAKAALDSLAQRTSYRNYRVVLVAPQVVEDQFVKSLSERFDRPVTVVRPDGDLHRSGLLNHGLVACDSQRAVLFDQHNEVMDADWLQILLGYEARERVAMIAPVITDGEGSIISAGLAITPTPHHIGQGHGHLDPGPLGLFVVAHECFGVATNCALVDVAILKSVGGLNTGFRSRYHDFDLARKLNAFGFHSMVTPLTRIRSHESEPHSEAERELFESRWRWLPVVDPYVRIDTRKLVTQGHSAMSSRMTSV